MLDGIGTLLTIDNGVACPAKQDEVGIVMEVCWGGPSATWTIDSLGIDVAFLPDHHAIITRGGVFHERAFALCAAIA
jgi:hypothetical protein